MDAPLENRKIEIEQEILKHLDATRKWTMFIAIIGFIFLGLLIVIGIIAGTFLSAFKTSGTDLGLPESIIFILLLILAVIYYLPLHFLFLFSKHAAHAVQKLDRQELHKALKNLKLYFAFTGILIIIVLSFYLIALIIAGTSLAFLKGLG